jgi:CBS domain-containing protein
MNPISAASQTPHCINHSLKFKTRVRSAAIMPLLRRGSPGLMGTVRIALVGKATYPWTKNENDATTDRRWATLKDQHSQSLATASSGTAQRLRILKQKQDFASDAADGKIGPMIAGHAGRLVERRSIPTSKAWRPGGVLAATRGTATGIVSHHVQKEFIMLVSDVMTPQAECVHPSASLRTAAERMKVLDVGSLPVNDGEQLIGIVTDRDITVRAVADGLDPLATTVDQVMTTGLEFCFEDESIRKAAEQMEECQIRRLIVLSREKQLVGIVSLGDIAVRNDDDALTGEALDQISRPVPSMSDRV